MNIKSLSIVRKLVIIVLVLVALNTIVLFSVRIYTTGSASISCSGNLFCLDFIVFAIIGFTYNELVFILLFYAIRRKSRALGVIGLVLLASILRYPVQDYIGSKLNIINSQNEYAAPLKKIEFAIYRPTYLPSSLVFSDWENSNSFDFIFTFVGFFSFILFF